ncbi:protein ALP1-like [Malania oleifera]|uniref:protein ALP1-like n=1 Tax=Malania oleifera TaxID=397392 RepID=UPI0025ADD5C4|nr:protein ALP1-like [Malania oleifera]
MDSRALAALLSSLVSELVLLLLLLFPSTPLSITANFNSNSNSNSNNSDPPTPNSGANLFHLIQYFLSSSEVAASLALLAVSKKRKRTHDPESDSDSGDEEKETEPGIRLGGDAWAQLSLARSPDSFKLCFRMTSSTFEWLSGLLEPLLECRDPVGLPLNLSCQIRLGIGLFRLATGSDYPELARRFGVSESVTRFCAKQLCRVLCTNFRFWVAFPGPADLESASAEFENLTGMPNCCGVIECTRFKILRSSGHRLSSEKEDQFFEETIAAQIVVDSSSRILSIIAGYRGEKGNSRVLKSSTLYKDIQGGSLLNGPSVFVNRIAIDQYLVGNGGYPLLPWLMVPFVAPVAGSCEENFNAAHNAMRLSAIRTLGSLKNWGVLSRPMQEEFKTAVAYIGACSILHNVLLMRDDNSALEDYPFHDQSSQSCYYRDTSLEGNLMEKKASAIRNALATRARVF